MDFISQVVATREGVKLKYFQKNLDELSVDVERLESMLALQLKRKDIFLVKSKLANSSFKDDVEKLLESARSLNEHLMQDVSQGVSVLDENEVNMTKRRIEDIETTLMFFENILKIDQLITSSEGNLLPEPVIAVHTLLQLIKTIDDNIGKGFGDYLQYAMHIAVSNLTKLKVKALYTWKESVSLDTFQEGAETKCSELSVMFDLKTLSESFQILSLTKEPVLHRFSQRFLECIIEPVLLNTVCLKLRLNSPKKILTISYLKKSPKMSFSTVTGYLVKIFEMINTYLNVKGENGTSLINELGANCSEQFTNLFIQHHLSCFDEGRSTIIQLTNQLVDTLSELSFILSDDYDRLKKYLVEEDDAYGFLSTIDFTSEAMHLIKKNLLSTFTAESVEMDDLPQDITVSNRCPDLTTTVTQVIFHHQKYIFPKCCVSTSMKELEELIYRIVEETEVLTEPLMNTPQQTKIIYDILQIYLDFLHSEKLSPKQSALVYNNSMYLIMKLILIDKGIPLCGFVSKLEEHGLEELQRCVDNQENALRSTLDAGLVDLSDKKELPESCKRAVDSSLKQLSSLQRDWFDVLPSDIYCQAMGYLCCKLLDRLISEVLSSKGISSKVRSELYKLNSSVTQQIFLKFKDVSSADQCVKSWPKWCELNEILLGDPSSIKAKKSGGKVSHFNGMEIRYLISSLFPHFNSSH